MPYGLDAQSSRIALSLHSTFCDAYWRSPHHHQARLETVKVPILTETLGPSYYHWRMPGRTYTDETRANVLATLQANGGNAVKTAKQLGIPRTTIRQWAGEANLGPGVAVMPRKVPTALVEGKMAELANNLEAVAFKAVELANEKADGASYKDLLVGTGIAVEKMLLLRGQATSRVETFKVSLVGVSDLRTAALRSLDSDSD